MSAGAAGADDTFSIPERWSRLHPYYNAGATFGRAFGLSTHGHE
jgi:hypothetical protein